MYNKIHNYLCIKVITADLIYYTSGIYIALPPNYLEVEETVLTSSYLCMYLCTEIMTE